ncbi:MAG: germination protein YpeB [Clostridia bacterium]|nr:germination protein YpeB [Clostridia bacterium]
MKRKGWIITASVLGAVLVAGAITWTGISLGTTMNALGQYKTQLEYVYERNLYELTENINNIESNLSKLKVSTDSQVQERYLASTVALANTAQNNIAVLPIEHNSINDTISFVNQLSGFCLVLQQNLAQGKKISLDDMDQIAQMHTSSQNIKYELNRLSVMVSSDYSIVDNIQNPNQGSSNFNEGFSGLNNEIVDYPQLIYDGPFSESTTNKEIKGLSTNEINAEEALNKMREWFADYSIKATGETTGGTFDAYNFELTKGEQTYYAQVTKRDGILMQLNGGYEAGESGKTEEECRTIAETFAKTLGFEDLQAVWSATSNGFVYINLCPVINKVIIYPDLIKVKVAQDNGDIVGWEAKSWAYNNVERSNLTASITETKALESLTTDMDVRTTKLALIPNEYVGETLCYEFMCINEGSTYYIYIDANTGLQMNILKIVETDDGNLLM